MSETKDIGAAVALEFITTDLQHSSLAEIATASSAQSGPLSQPSTRYSAGSSIAIIPDDGIHTESILHGVSKTSASDFNVRAANYKKLNKKEPSLASFYELVGFDLFKTAQVVQHVASFLSLDSLDGGGSSSHPEHPDLPTFFIVNCQLPDGEPSMFGGGSDDGPGRSVVFFFKLKRETVDALTQEVVSPALHLLTEYFRRATEDPDFRGRFKVIASVKNIEKLELPSFIENYNGKPVLITKSGSIFKGSNYVEVDIRVHRFSYLARKGLNFLQSKFNQMVFDVGFVIEGRSDEELPEQILGAARLIRLDYDQAMPFP